MSCYFIGWRLFAGVYKSLEGNNSHSFFERTYPLNRPGHIDRKIRNKSVPANSFVFVAASNAKLYPNFSIVELAIKDD